MKNLKSYLLVGVLCSSLTLGVYKLAGLDNKQVVITETTPGGLTRFTNQPTARPAGPMVDFTFAAEKTTPAVVHIRSTVSGRSAMNTEQMPEMFRDLFGEGSRGNRGMPEKQQASGSGVIISADGYIITNNHVVEDASEVEVSLSNKRTFKAKVIGTDPSTDLAVIQIKATDLPALAFGNSDAVKVGEWVMAVGNPFDLESTVTAGIVSAKGRNLGIIANKERQRQFNFNGGDDDQNPTAQSSVSNSIESFIQTDAAVNPGNSGGALVNLQGDLIGINTAIISRTGSYAGYSFAVPANLVRKVTEDIIKFGSVQRGYLGVEIRNLDGRLAQELGLTINEGVYVAGLSPDGSAIAAGVQKGDVIVKVDGLTTNSAAELQEQVARRKIGDVVTVTVNRAGKERDVRVTLKGRAADARVAARTDRPDDVMGSLGASFQELTAQEKKTLGLDGGVKVTRLTPGKLRSETDMREGFVITKVNGKSVRTVKELNQLLDGQKNSEDGVMLQGTYPDFPGKYYYAFGMK